MRTILLVGFAILALVGATIAFITYAGTPSSPGPSLGEVPTKTPTATPTGSPLDVLPGLETPGPSTPATPSSPTYAVGPFLVATTPIANPTYPTTQRRLFRAPDGTLAVLYARPAAGGQQVEMVIVHSHDGGQTWHGEQPVGLESTVPAFSGVMDENGNIYVAYSSDLERDYAGGIRLRTLTYHADTQTWTPGLEHHVVVDEPGAGATYPVLALTGERLWLAYRHFTRRGHAVAVKYADPDPQGDYPAVNWSPPAVLSGYLASPTVFPVLVPHGSRLAVVYLFGESLLNWRWLEDPIGFPNDWAPEDTIYRLTRSEFIGPRLSATADGQGNVHLAFSLNNHTVGYIKYDGSQWSQPLLLAANNNEWPTISTDGPNLWVFWEQDWGIGYNRIVHRRLVGNGQWDRTAITSWAQGFERPFDAVWIFQQRTGTYTDERRRAAETAPSMALPFLVEPGDMLYLGQSEKFSYVLFGLSQAAGADPQPAWEYWNGSAWVPLTLTSNAQYRFHSATPEQVQFAIPEDWQVTEVNGYRAYYIRVRRQSTTDLTPPVATQILPVRNMHSPLAQSGPNGTIDLIWTESAGGAFPNRVWYGATSMHPIELPSPGRPPHDHGPVPLPPDVPPPTPTPPVTPTSTPTPGVSPTATPTPVPSPTAAPTPTPTPVPLPTNQPTITSFNGRKVHPAPAGTLPLTVELRSGESVQFTLLDGSLRTVTLRGTRLVHAQGGVTVYAMATVEVSGPGLQSQQAEIPAAYFHSPAILNDVRVFVDITKEFNDPGLIDGGGTTADARLLLSDARFTMSDVSKYRWPIPSLLWWEGGYHAHWQGLGGDPGRLWHHRGFDMGMPPNTPVHAWASGTLKMTDRGWDRTVQLENAGDGRPFFEHSVFHFDRVEPTVVGQPVQPGDLLGYSGRANWYHIHFANVFQWEPLLAEWYMAHATPVQLSYIREWLALGPFFHNDDILRLTTPYIENEAFVEPEPGDVNGGMTWRLWDNVVPGVVHVAETLDPYPNSGWAWVNGNYLNHAAYLATYIYSSEARSAVLRIGTSDAVRVWLNNEAVLLLDNCLPNDYPMSSRSIVPDDVAVNINLRAGWNRLLIKTAQKSHFGDCWKPWQLTARISDAQGNPIPDLVVSALKQLPGTPAPTPQPTATPQPTPGAGPVALTRYPYLQNSSQTAMTVVWRTDVAGEGCVDYGPTPAYGTTLCDRDGGAEHVVQMGDLIPGTTYYYRVRTNGVVLHQGKTFRTHKNEQGGAFTFAALGDTGCGCPDQQAVARLLKGLNPDFILHTGDVVYPNGQAANYDPNFFSLYRDILDTSIIFPVLGNHDVETDNGAPFLEAFFLPANNPARSERYYSFDYGNAHFIALDSNQDTSPGSPQYTWLEQDLATTTKKWKFVFMHHQPYDVMDEHPSDTELRNNLSPLFERYNVDVVFSGHGHRYVRSKVVKDYYPESRGVVYVVTGGGGGELATVNQWTPWTAYAASAHHVVQVEVGPDQVLLKAIRPDGTILDTYAITRAGP